MTNKEAQRESTLLAVIAQAWARGGDIAEYEAQLVLESSRRLVQELKDTPEQSSLKRWVDSL